MDKVYSVDAAFVIVRLHEGSKLETMSLGNSAAKSPAVMQTILRPVKRNARISFLCGIFMELKSREPNARRKRISVIGALRRFTFW